MPWNEPGNNGNNNQQDPWGGKRNNQNPPDLDKMLSDFIKKLRSLFNPNTQNSPSWGGPSNKKSGFAAGMVAVFFFAVWFFSGFFLVNPAEQGVILRFGKFSEVLQPGLHWMARFVDTKYLVDAQKIYSFSLEGDFLTKSSEQGDLPNQYINIDSGKKSADSSDQSKNLVNVELNVQYRVSNPRAYLFNVVNPDGTMQQVATGALSDEVGQMKLDEVLTTGRESLSTGVQKRVVEILGNYNTGLEVVAVTLRKVQAPDQVRAAFSDVNRADQDRATTIQQAQAYASKVVPIALGNAARISADANAYKQQVVLGAQANVARFQALLQAYQGAPDVTRERLYLDSMQRILENTSKVLVNVNSSNNLLYLPLDKLMRNAVKPLDAAANSDNGVIANVAQPTTPNNATHDYLSSSSNASTGVEVKNDTN